MHIRQQTGRSMSKRLLLGVSALVGIGLVSACFYFSQSKPQWGWASQQAATRGYPQLVLEEQNRLIEAIYQETQAAQNEELAKLKPTDFTEGIAIMSNDGWDWKLKYIWDYFLPVYNCPLKEKVGIVPRLGDNGKWLCGVRSLLQKDNCIVYSMGSNGETSFEQDLLRKTNCKVHIFDPTLPPDVLEQVRSIKGVTVHTYGLGPSDGMVQLTDPRQSMKKGFVEFEVKSLSTIMKELKHSWVDVLKIDIEGAEWPVLKALVKSKKALPFTQLQVEYHYFHQTNITVPRDMLEVLSGLQARDLRVFHVEPNYWWHNYAQEFIEFAYIQVGKVGEIVTGPSQYSRKYGGIASSV